METLMKAGAVNDRAGFLLVGVAIRALNGRETEPIPYGRPLL
jgi:hypothetical protein